MSTPNANNTSKATPRIIGGATPSASTPSRSIPSPAQLTNASSKTVGRSPWRGVPSPFAGSLNVQTPTPLGNAVIEGSPAITLEGVASRARTVTIGAKSAVNSPASQTPAAFSGLGLTLTPFANGLGAAQQLNENAILDSLGLIGRDTEAWTTQRTKEIVDLLGTRWGLVGQDNVKRCVDRIGGRECYWEDHPGGKEKIGERKRTLAIAGNEMMLEIGWLGEKVVKVGLNFMRGSEENPDEVGAEILRQNLIGRNGIYVEIGAFVENLSRLARIDQLGRGKVSCFEALEGVGNSLKRLWELELAKEQETTTKRSTAELTILCERSGRPLSHSNNTLSLRLDYWLDRRLVVETEIEDNLSSDGIKNPFSLLIDCEAFDAAQYPPIRTSQAWLSTAVSDAISDPTLSIWDEPPPTFIPGTQIENVPDVLNLGVATTGTQPDVRFIAKLKPAIVLPLDAAMEILTHMNQTLMQSQSTTYLGLLFPNVLGFQTGTKEGKIIFQRSVVSLDAAENKHDTKQKLMVFVRPDSWAQSISEVPFSHPRQLIDILPYLRQWAFFGRFLQRSFGGSVYNPASSLQAPPLSASSSNVTANKPNAKHPVRLAKPVNGYRMKYQQYEPASDTDSEEDQQITSGASDAMAPPQALAKQVSTGQQQSHGALETIVETSFTYTGIARRIDMVVTVVIPVDGDSTCACVFNLKIHLNAKLEVDSDVAIRGDQISHILDSETKVECFRKRLERTVRITEDIGATAAWLQMFIKQFTKA